MPLTESELRLLEVLKQKIRDVPDNRVPMPKYSKLMTQAHRFNRAVSTGFGAWLEAPDGSFVQLLSKPPHIRAFLKILTVPDDHYRLIVYLPKTEEIRFVDPGNYRTTGGTYGATK